MGLNFYLGCSHCREKIYLFRGRETAPMQHFYTKHRNCGTPDSAFDIQEEGRTCDWTQGQKDGGYKTDVELQDRTLPKHLKE